MQRKTFTASLIALAAAGLLPLAAQAQAVKLTLGHGAAPGNPRHEAAVKFAEVAKAKSGGQIEVSVSPSAQLGDDAAMVTALRTGALDLSANSQGAVAGVVPEYAAFGMPFLFANLGQAWKLLDGPLGQELAAKSADKGLVVLGYWDNGIRHMSNSKKPITKPEDMKGMKMRTPPDAVTVDIMQSLGAEAQQIKFAELYVALQQGVVDGQENPLMNINASKLYEVNKFVSLTGHKYEMTPLLMSKRSWDKLSDAHKKALQEAAAEATALQRKLSQEADDKLVADLKGKGVQVNVADKAAFEKATEQVDDKWMASPIGAYVKKVITAARAKYARPSEEAGHEVHRTLDHQPVPGGVVDHDGRDLRHPVHQHRAALLHRRQPAVGCGAARAALPLDGHGRRGAGCRPGGAHHHQLPDGHPARGGAPPRGHGGVAVRGRSLRHAGTSHLEHARHRGRREVAHPAGARIGDLRLRHGRHGHAGRARPGVGPGAVAGPRHSPVA